MHTIIETITPASARRWLLANTNNRAIRPSHVAELVRSFTRGEYVMTHQGIAFNAAGELMDGQHRLSAIALMPDDFSLEMNVTYDVPDEAYHAMDTKLSSRNNADALHMEKHLATTGNFMSRWVNGEQPTPMEMVPYAEFAKPGLDLLLAASSRNVKVWASSAVRTICIIAMHRGRYAPPIVEYVTGIYAALATSDYANMPPVAHALMRQQESGKLTANAGWRSQENDLMARVARVIDPRHASATKLVIHDPIPILLVYKDALNRAVPQPAAPSRTAVRNALVDLHATYAANRQ